MRNLQCALAESLLDSEFDITDNDVVISRLEDWLKTVRNKPFPYALDDMLKAMSGIAEVSPMKRSKLAETNTIVTIQGNHGYGYGNIVYRGNHACFSHISFSWSSRTIKRCAFSKGKINLIEFSNKRKNPDLHCWAIPAEAFDILYNSVQ